MAHYSSDSHLWSDRHFLRCDRLQRLIVLYIMHGPGRSNVPGLCEDSAVTIADRLQEKVDDVRDALTRMCDDAELLQMDEENRLLRCPLATRMDPFRGSNAIRGWHKNWAHMVDSKIKYAHIVQLGEKVDRTRAAEVAAWDETFGAEKGGRYRLSAQEPAQQSLLPKDQRGRQKKKSPKANSQARHAAALEELALPGRDSSEQMDSNEYSDRYAADLLAAGTVGEMGANAEMFATALHAMTEKRKGDKRASDWDKMALTFVEKQVDIEVERQVFIEAKNKKRGHTHENHRPSDGETRRTSRTRDRGATEEDSAHWGEVFRRKAAATAAAADT